MSDTQRDLGLVKKDRVYLRYKPLDGKGQDVELPFIVGVMANLAGDKSVEDRGDLSEREFRKITGNTFDSTVADVGPELRLTVKNRLSNEPEPGQENIGVHLKFERMTDFEPMGIARQVPELKELMDLRNQLSNLRAYLDGKPGAQRILSEKLAEIVASLSK